MPKGDSQTYIVGGVLAVMMLMLLVAASPVGKMIDHFYLDVLFNVRGKLPAPEDIIVVGIDEASFAEINKQWPWPRSLHAQLTESLYAAGAKTVIFDVLFPEPSEIEQDSRFSAVINRFPDTFLAMDINLVEKDRWVQQILVKPSLSLSVKDNQLGVINILTQSDGFVRNIQLEYGNFSAISLVAAKNYRYNCCKNLPKEKSILINYFGPQGTVNTVSYYQALEPKRFLGEHYFKDKIIFVGVVTQSASTAAQSAADHFPVPFSKSGAGYMPGVEIHATVSQNLLDETYIKSASVSVIWAFSLLVLAIFSFLYINIKPFINGMILLVTVAVVFSLSYYLFNTQFIYLPVSLILFPLINAWAVSPLVHYYKSNKDRRFLQNAFGNYLSPALVEQIIEHPEMLSLGGKKVEASVLFLDVAGFTTMSEKFEPMVLISIMNHCLGAVTDVVMKHDGMIDKFIGDAVMAIWGAPLEQENHAYNACLAAIEVQERMKEVSKTEKAVTGAELTVRVGVNTGFMVAGNVGGTRRFEYTVHGNDVNVASRLEGANKFYNTEIMIGENTADQVRGLFDMRLLDRVRLKGKAEAIGIYELQGRKGEVSSQQIICNQHYKKARNFYECNLWSEAIEEFRKALKSINNDGPSLVMIERCKCYMSHPPNEGWGGIYDMTSK